MVVRVDQSRKELLERQTADVATPRSTVHKLPLIQFFRESGLNDRDAENRGNSRSGRSGLQSGHGEYTRPSDKTHFQLATVDCAARRPLSTAARRLMGLRA